MNIPHCFLLVGLLGLLTGCVTPDDIGYLFPPGPGYETTPVYTTPAYTTPVYNTSPAYYTTPGYSTTTIYDGYHPGYGGPHRPPPPMAFGRDHDRHGKHGGHGHGGSSVRPIASPTHTKTPSRINPGNSKRTSNNQVKNPRPKSMPSKEPPSKGVSGKGRKK